MLYEAFFRKVLKDKNIDILKDFKEDDFVGEYSKVYQYILKHRKIYKEFPLWETIAAEFKLTTTDIILDEPIAFYADKVHQNNLIQDMRNSLDSNTKELNKNPEKVLDALKQEFKRIAERRIRSKRGKIIRWNDAEEVQERIKRYIEKKNKNGQLLGIPTPWSSINLNTNGIEPGKFWVIVAKLKTGKTWISLVLARFIWSKGYNVLFVTPEVSVNVLSDRTDTTQTKVDYASFRRGDLDIYSEKKHIDNLGKISESENSLWIAGDGMVKSISDIEDIMDIKSPNIVIIDGAYLINPSKKFKDKTEKVRALSEELAILSTYTNIPIVITHQFNRSVDDESISAGADKIGSAYELAQDCDALIGLFNNTYMRRNALMAIRLLENREGDRLNVLANFNLETMDFGERGIFFGDDIDNLFVTESETQQAGVW